MLSRALALIVILIASAVAAGESALTTASATHTVPVTVTITRVKALDDGLDGTFRDEPDLYAGFVIGSSGLGLIDCGTFADHVDDQAEIFPTDWTCSAPVVVDNDSSPGLIYVAIEIWDHDDCDTPFCDDTGEFESDDDMADASPGGNGKLSLFVSLSDGKWSGFGSTTNVDWPQNCVQGTGESAVLVCFEISIDSANGDADGDFLLDGWERNGYNADGDGSVDVDLPAMGANVGRKDLFLEVDCIADSTNATPALRHTHCPAQAAMQDVVRSFANAPEPNPDGTTGIQLHIDVGTLYPYAAPGFETIAGAGGAAGTLGDHGGGGSQIDEGGNTIIDWDGATGRAGTSFYTLKTANFNTNRAAIYRYAIFGHQTNSRAAMNDCTSGWAEGVTSAGNDFMVTLGGVNSDGSDCWVADANSNSVGSRAQQAGTLMHELGHTLALAHGGGDGVNDKPNYLSVMNYTFQFCSLAAVGPLPGGCDFSRDDLNDLNEMHPPGLDECQGIDGGLYGMGPNNWDGDGGLTGPNLEGASCVPANGGSYSRNINGDYVDSNNNGSQDPGEADTLSALAGYDDWANLKYDFRFQRYYSDGGVPPFPDEATPEMIMEARDAFAALVRPNLALDKTGPADAIPGDTLHYNLSVSNTGNGPALNVNLTDTTPDSSTTPFAIGNIVAGASAARQLSYDVGCTIADGTVLVNSATTTGVDLLGNVFQANDSVSTTIYAPVLTVGKTATASVAAGEAITYTITYANTGSAGATGVTIVDTLPAGVYYSLALDLGTGPRPSSAAKNAAGQWVLTWNLGTLAGASGNQVIEFTARPTLLVTGSETLMSSATISYTNANGCTYSPVSASASTAIVVVAPTRDPRGLGYWRNKPAELSAEVLARIQATDQRFDGADGSSPDGRLSAAEVAAVLRPGGNMDKVLKEQLVSTYANLATRRFNAGTGLDSRLTTRLGLSNVASAAYYAIDTLKLPVNSSTRGRFSDITTVLDQANNGRNLVY
ncbi:MAG: DUF11 domain-containing protein [Dehalococcoidia bacterium]|nr:DUF11 domain-containing protein [Dehalococcoidia bacterium]